MEMKSAAQQTAAEMSQQQKNAIITAAKERWQALDPSSPFNNPGPAPGYWNEFRDLFETAAILAGNYITPGSSAITSNLASKGSQQQLNSDLGIIGQIGTGIAGGLNGNVNPTNKLAENAVGYNPTIADSIWSESATPISNFTANAGINTINGAVKGGLTAGLQGNSLVNGALQGGVSGGVNTAVSGGLNAALGTGTNSAWDKALGIGGSMLSNGITSNLFKPSNNSSSSNIFNTGSNNGGSMATNTETNDPNSFNLTSFGSALAPFLSAYNSWNQAGNTKDAYNQAINLITTPSADQQKYRTQLSTLLSNPGSMTTSPVYQAMLDSGTNAVNRSAAASGMLNSGNRLSDLMNQGQKTAAQYYFPQANLLTSLSGVPGDQAARATGASALISGQSANNQLQNQMLDSLMMGMGAQTPAQQLIAAMTGNKDNKVTNATSPLSTLVTQAKNWFNGPDNTTDYSNYSTSPVFDNNLSWSNLLGGSNGTNYTTPIYDPGVNLGGSQNDYINSLLNGSGSLNNISWF